MLLSRDDARLFSKLQHSLFHFVNQRLAIAPEITSPDEFGLVSPEKRVEFRKALLGEIGLIESFVSENPANLSADQLSIVSSWRHQLPGTFFVFRQLKNYMIFLTSGDSPAAYGVVAITDRFEDLLGPDLPRMIETVLLPFKEKIVFDGVLRGYNISFGGGVKRSLDDSYREAKRRMGIITSLPVESAQTPPRRTTKPAKRKPKKKSSGTDDVKQQLQTIVGMTDAFCREHLNAEYAEMCGKLAEKLSRKRPSPLLRGQPKTWACGIIRTIGLVNFLDDRTFQPYMKLTEIDKLLGVGQSTAQAKSMEIRKMLKIRQFDMHWTLPSQMDDNPMVWMLEVDGFLMDVRNAPRAIQEIAYEKGLIPYIPAEHETDLPNSAAGPSTE